MHRFFTSVRPLRSIDWYFNSVRQSRCIDSCYSSVSPFRSIDSHITIFGLIRSDTRAEQCSAVVVTYFHLNNYCNIPAGKTYSLLKYHASIQQDQSHTSVSNEDIRDQLLSTTLLLMSGEPAINSCLFFILSFWRACHEILTCLYLCALWKAETTLACTSHYACLKIMLPKDNITISWCSLKSIRSDTNA